MNTATVVPAKSSIKICSIAPEEFKIKRSYNWNGIVLPGCAAGQKYTSVTITDHADLRVVAVDHWAEHSEKTPVNIPADQIVRDFFATENLRNRGAFIPAGEEPTEEELAQARATRRTYLETCVRNGDEAYSINAKIADIPGEWKKACQELKVTREWAFYAAPETQDCPACGETLKPGVAICKSCGAILDREKAEKYGLVSTSEEAPVKKPKTI